MQISILIATVFGYSSSLKCLLKYTKRNINFVKEALSLLYGTMMLQKLGSTRK